MSEDIALRWISPDAENIEAEVGRIDSVISRAYSFTTRADRVWRFLAAQPDGWIVAEQGGHILSTGGCIAYPSGGFGWIGLIATDPDHRGKGLARLVTTALVERLRVHGCAAVLDGSNAGAPLYEKMGFVDHGLTKIFRPVEMPTEPIAHSAEPLRVHEVEDVVAYDAPKFGADRGPLLRYLVHNYSTGCLVTRHASGSISGYAICQDDMIGPIVGDSADAVRSLVNASLGQPWTTKPSIMVPAESTYADDLVACGLQEVRSLRHQRLGIDTLPGQRQHLAGQASLGEG